MKHAEKATQRLLEIGEEIRSGKRNPRHALAEVHAIGEAGRIAFSQSTHQRYQKAKIRVRFFDQNVPAPGVVVEVNPPAVTGTLTIKDGKKSKKVSVSSKR